MTKTTLGRVYRRQTVMNREIQNRVQKGTRWLRVGVLTLTMAGPIVNTLLKWLRQRSQSLGERSADLQQSASAVQATALDRFNEFALAGRQRAVEQVRLLQEQTQQLRSQTRHLRKALRKEAKQFFKRNDVLKDLRAFATRCSQD